MSLYYYTQAERASDGYHLLTLTVREWTEQDDEMTGDLRDANGDILPDDSLVTLRCAAGRAVQYCVGNASGQSEWLDTDADFDSTAWREAVESVEHTHFGYCTRFKPGEEWLDRIECEEAAYEAILEMAS